MLRAFAGVTHKSGYVQSPHAKLSYRGVSCRFLWVSVLRLRMFPLSCHTQVKVRHPRVRTAYMLTSRSLGKLQCMVHRATYDLVARIYILLKTNGCDRVATRNQKRRWAQTVSDYVSLSLSPPPPRLHSVSIVLSSNLVHHLCRLSSIPPF